MIERKRWLWPLTVVALTVALTAHAQVFDLVAGPTMTSSERTTAALFASVSAEPPADEQIHFEPIGTVGWIAAHHTSRENLHHEAALAGVGMQVVAPDRRWFASEQVAATTTRTDALSSRFQFMTSVGWRDGHFVMMLRHISNGHLVGGGRNLGETMLLAGIRW